MNRTVRTIERDTSLDRCTHCGHTRALHEHGTHTACTHSTRDETCLCAKYRAPIVSDADATKLCNAITEVSREAMQKIRGARTARQQRDVHATVLSAAVSQLHDDARHFGDEGEALRAAAHHIEQAVKILRGLR